MERKVVKSNAVTKVLASLALMMLLASSAWAQSGTSVPTAAPTQAFGREDPIKRLQGTNAMQDFRKQNNACLMGDPACGENITPSLGTGTKYNGNALSSPAFGGGLDLSSLISGDCTIGAGGAIICTKTSGNAFTSNTFGSSVNLTTPGAIGGGTPNSINTNNFTLTTAFNLGGSGPINIAGNAGAADDVSANLNGELVPAEFGVVSGSTTTTTGTISGSSSTLTLASASTFLKNQYAIVVGAGAATSLSPAATPTVTATGSGATSYTYTWVPLDGLGGYPAGSTASSAVTNAAIVSLNRTTNYNLVCEPTPVEGVFSYELLRVVSGTTYVVGIQPNISGIGNTSVCLKDYGQSISVSGIPTDGAGHNEIPSSVPVTPAGADRMARELGRVPEMDADAMPLVTIVGLILGPGFRAHLRDSLKNWRSTRGFD